MTCVSTESEAKFMEFGKNGKIIRVVAKRQRLTGGIPTCIDARKAHFELSAWGARARRRLGYSKQSEKWNRMASLIAGILRTSLEEV